MNELSATPVKQSHIEILYTLSPLDGRYANKVLPLRKWLSEFALIKHRAKVEVYWLLALNKASLENFPTFSQTAGNYLLMQIEDFNLSDAKRIKDIELITQHDVKAVEYWLKEKCATNSELAKASEFIHFACTSEDINSNAYAMMLVSVRAEVLLPTLNKLMAQLKILSNKYAANAMLSRTHGQAASPTTLGKEFANVYMRLEIAATNFAAVDLFGKMNGAVGNYNAHIASYPSVDWELLAKNVVEQDFGLKFNTHTTQIEPHDSIAQLCDAIARINTILIDLNRDLWGYISLGYFNYKAQQDSIGSSTMPHKINPIDFENSEGNLGLANALLRHLADKLPISRWQRDLTDSTVLRNIAIAIGYSLLAYNSCIEGLSKLELNSEKLHTELSDSWEILTEAVQTVMRRYSLPNAYEQLKSFTRNQSKHEKINKQELHKFIQSLDLSVSVKTELLSLRPETYIGLASKLANI